MPLLALVLLTTSVSVSSGVSTVTGSLLPVGLQKESQEFSLPGGEYGMLYGATHLEEIEEGLVLHEGSLLLASESSAKVVVDGAQVHLLHGAIHISKGSDTTIVALTSPAYIEKGDLRMIVPIGMQWTLRDSFAPMHEGFDAWMSSRVPKSLPQAFTKRKLEDLVSLAPSSPDVPTARRSFSVPLLSRASMALPVTRRRIEKRQQDAVLGSIAYAVQQGDSSVLEQLLNEADASSQLSSVRGRQVLGHLLAKAKDDAAIALLLLRELATEEPLWMLGSFHPEYRDTVWSLFEPSVSTESMLSRVFLLPYSLIGPEEFSVFVLERFTLTTKDILRSVGNKEAFTQHMLEVHTPFVLHLDSLGYPRRAEHLAVLLTELGSRLEEPSLKVQSSLESLVQREQVIIEPLPEKEVVEEVVEEEIEEEEPEQLQPEVVLPEREVINRAYALLQGADALFTVETEILASGVNTAHIKDIIFSAEHADRSVEFSLNVLTGIVTNMVIDGNSDFPYSPSFEGFVEWIAK